MGDDERRDGERERKERPAGVPGHWEEVRTERGNRAWLNPFFFRLRGSEDEKIEVA